ncbi:MAG: hypothetical protein GY722_21005 [bacterium]|nr:hypothetical protein [bacterium]
MARGNSTYQRLRVALDKVPSYRKSDPIVQEAASFLLSYARGEFHIPYDQPAIEYENATGKTITTRCKIPDIRGRAKAYLEAVLVVVGQKSTVTVNDERTDYRTAFANADPVPASTSGLPGPGIN